MDNQHSSKQMFIFNTLLRVVLLLLIFVMCLYLSKCEVARIDLTADQNYTLTNSTKKMLSGLEKRVLIKAFFSREVPSYFQAAHDGVKDFLSEYEALADGMLIVEYVDPAEDQVLQDEAQRLGIAGVPLQDASGQKFSMQKVYQGLRVRVGDRQKVLDLTQLLAQAFRGGLVPSQFEYLFTNAISELVAEKKPKIALYAKAETPPMNPYMRQQQPKGATYRNIEEALKGRYQVDALEFTHDSKIPADTDILIVVGPKDFDEHKLFDIDQYLVKGGKAIFFMEENNFNMSSIMKSDFKSGMQEMLGHYGVDVPTKLVADLRGRMDFPVTKYAFFGGRQVPVARIPVPYPYWVIAHNTEWSEKLPDFPNALNGMNQDVPAVSKLKSAYFFWCAPVLIKDKLAAGITAKVLLRSSPMTLTGPIPQTADPGRDDAGIQKFMGDLNRRFSTEKPAQTPLAVELSGCFTSFFKGKKLPAPPKKEKSPPGQNPPPGIPGMPGLPPGLPGGDRDGLQEVQDGQDKPVLPIDPDDVKEADPAPAVQFVAKSDKPATMVVLGDSTFLCDQLFAEQNAAIYQANRGLFLNLVDSLGLNQDLVELRGRNTKVRKLELVQEEENETPEHLDARERAKKWWIKWSVIVIVPFFLLIFGLLLWVVRSAGKRHFVQAQD